MLLNQAKAGKVAGDDARREVHLVVAADLGLGAWDSSFDSLLHFGRRWHQETG